MFQNAVQEPSWQTAEDFAASFNLWINDAAGRAACAEYAIFAQRGGVDQRRSRLIGGARLAPGAFPAGSDRQGR
jgi:hypothetical protein